MARASRFHNKFPSDQIVVHLWRKRTDTTPSTVEAAHIGSGTSQKRWCWFFYLCWICSSAKLHYILLSISDHSNLCLISKKVHNNFHAIEQEMSRKLDQRRWKVAYTVRRQHTGCSSLFQDLWSSYFAEKKDNQKASKSDKICSPKPLKDW
jgi:hypothetical protein